MKLIIILSMTYSTIADYNKYLIEFKQQVDIIEYVKNVNKIIYCQLVKY
jgi:hypothetical protein